MIEGHGDDIYRYGERVKYNFSSNILQCVDHSALMRYISSLEDSINHYPEPLPYSLAEKLSGLEGVREGNILVTNGATEAFYLIAHCFQGATSAIVVPTFREYQDACTSYSHKVEFLTVKDRFTENSGLIWICNPNNPTGEAYDKASLLEIARKNPDKVFIIDQAYENYSVRAVISPREAVSAGNIILVKSLTKRFSIPGLRLGYIIGDSDLIARISIKKMPWSVNGIALKAAEYLLEREREYPIDACSLHSEALIISRAFRECGIEVSDTDCNFVLCKLPKGSAAELKDYLITNHGILIRDASNFEGLGREYFRVAAQTEEENFILIEAVKQWCTL